MTTESPIRPHPGQALRDLLEEKGFSQSRAAEALGITRQHLNSIINGHNPISADLKLKLQDYLHVPPSHWTRLQEQQDRFVESAEGRQVMRLRQQAELLEHLEVNNHRTLVDHEIDEAVRAGWLGIEPFDPSMLSPSGCWLSLGLRGAVHALKDPSAHPEETEVVLKPAFDLRPGMVLTLLSHEKITLPPQLEARVATEAEAFCVPGLSLKCQRHFDSGLGSRIAMHLINESGRVHTLRHQQQALLLQFVFHPVAPARAPSTG